MTVRMSDFVTVIYSTLVKMEVICMCIESSFISLSLTVAVPAITTFLWSGPIAMQLSNHHFGINHSIDFQRLGKTKNKDRLDWPYLTRKFKIHPVCVDLQYTTVHTDP